MASTERESTPYGNDHAGSEFGLEPIIPHLYRAEVDRAVSWRQRLDSTTNFAMTIMGAILAYAFAGQGAGHTTILIAMLVGLTFLLIEANRYQQYDIWRSRVRSMQENVFADALDPSGGTEQTDWREQLSRDYRNPTQKMPFRDAVSHRLRRVYLPVLVGLLVIWVFHLLVYGATGSPVDNAAVEAVPGAVVLAVVGLSYLGIVAAALLPDLKTESEGDQLAELDARR
ncbi:DUF2270 domain-containing protein [Halohasta salina]|uniref:DUF2270 domain-containing protein n=1 Tax=Halohasta salina TaxID=2961621 RepID=UPI0020A385A8|nr:DUF2270 domain-containing protein [Halohasta salina]